MRRSDEAVDGHTRRAFAKYGGTVALGGLLAGCAGGGAESDPSGSDGGDESYAASISPTGEVTFE